MKFTSGRKCSDMLRGSQDHALGLIGDNIIVVGGFCTSLDGCQTPEIFRSRANPKTSYERGFIKEIFSYSTGNDSWSTIGEIPINPRQCCSSIVLDNKMYVWGGFSYTPLTDEELKDYSDRNISLPRKQNIYSYADGCCLTYDNNDLAWHKCPHLPFPLVSFGLVKHEKTRKLYFINGAIYDRKSFNTFTTVNGVPVGKSFFSLSYDEDNNIVPDSVEYISNFPGSPRMSPATHIVGNYLYVIGGMNTTPVMNNDKGYAEYTYNNVIDNWRYDIDANTWESLGRFHVPICNQGSCLHENRYIVLMGGVKYNTTFYNNRVMPTGLFEKENLFTFNNISTIRNTYITPESTANQYNWYFSNLVILYDSRTNQFLISDIKLPININAAQVVKNADGVYIIGGEGNPFLLGDIYYGNCLSLTLKFVM